MASVAREPNGNRRILFVAPDGKRPTIRLGKMSQRDAEMIARHIEALLVAKTANQPLPQQTGSWLADVGEVFYKRLAAVGLVAKRDRLEAVTLGGFITSYVDSRTDAKPATKEVWRQGEMGLLGFFGADRPLVSVTPGEADSYKLHLIGKRLAPMTVRKRLQFATMVFRAAMRRRLIPENPFADVSIKASMPDRGRFVTCEETRRLLKACPDYNWRVIVALARYGGLRCPSEVLSLRRQDVDWEEGRIVVHSPKTEHHPGKETRIIPLFPELREPLLEAFEVAPEGSVYVVDERMRASAQCAAGWRNCNLRTQFERIIKRAGLTPWPRPFHNLRSSRQTELAERFPSHVVCEWLATARTLPESTITKSLPTTSPKQWSRRPIRAAQKAAHGAHKKRRSRLP